MKLVKYTILISTVGVILLYILIPHKHHGEITFEEHNIVHQKANEIIELISLVLHEGTSNTGIDCFTECRTQRKVEVYNYYNISVTDLYKIRLCSKQFVCFTAQQKHSLLIFIF